MAMASSPPSPRYGEGGVALASTAHEVAVAGAGEGAAAVGAEVTGFASPIEASAAASPVEVGERGRDGLICEHTK